MIICGIDPGPETSGVCVWDTQYQQIVFFNSEYDNNKIHYVLVVGRTNRIDKFVIEDIEYRSGVNVGKTVFDTCKTIGMLQERLGKDNITLYRKSAVSNHFKGLKLLKERYPKGTKKNPGMTYGLKSHAWDAFALCIWYEDNLK